MKRAAILIVAIMYSIVLSAQKAVTIFAELGGPGLASVNYDTRFNQKEDGFGGRIGIGAFSLRSAVTPNVVPKNTHALVIYIPIGVNYLVTKDNKNYFEVGAGVTPALTGKDFREDDFTSTFGYILAGYRMMPEERGLTIRIFVSPVFGSFGFIPYYGGLSIGYKFIQDKKKF